MILELLERRMIEVKNKDGVLHKVAWIIGDFGVHQSLSSGWCITHLPSGFRTLWTFKNAESAAEAAQELSTLKNTWAFLNHDEMHRLYKNVKEIHEKHGGFLALYGVSSRINNNMNGYAEAPTE